MSEPLLSIRDLAAGYGFGRVLFGLSLDAPRVGGIAVLGRNGAGKSTLLKAIVGEIAPLGGAVVFDGRDCAGEATESRVRRGLGYVPQEQAIFGTLTVRENLALGAMAQSGKAAFDIALDFFPKLGARLSQQAGTLSGGERKMLAIGRAILGKPRLLLLDEPTEGVWVGVIEEIAERLQLLSREISLVIVEQHVELALRVAGKAYVLDRGTVALCGTSEEIRTHPDLVRFLAP